MLKNTLIIVLLLLIIYLYYQQDKKFHQLHSFTSDIIFNPSENELTTFLKENLNSNTLEELKSKLGEKSLNELLEQNEDYETEVDTLTRAKNSLEQDLTTQSNTFQTRQREKDREIKKLKEDLKVLEKVREKLTSEKQQHKGSLERIKLLTEQITNLEKEKPEPKRSKSPMPGEFPENEKEELLKKISELEAENERLKEID